MPDIAHRLRTACNALTSRGGATDVPYSAGYGDSSGRGAQIAIVIAATILIAAACWLIPDPAVIVALGLLPLGGIAAFMNPFLLCLVFILFSFFRLHEAFPILYPLHIPQILAIGSLLVLGTQLGLRRIEIAWTRQLKMFAMLFGLITIGVFTATGRDIAMSYWTDTYVKIAIMVFAIASLARKPSDFAMGMRAFVLAGLLVSAVALYNSINEIGLVEGTRVTISREMRSVLGDPNDLSLVLLFPISFAAALVMTPRTGIMSRLYGLIGFAVIAAAVIATQSRGGLLGIVAVCATFGARRIKSRAVLITGGILALLVLSAAAGIGGRASGGAAEAGMVDESASGRLYAWQAAIRMAVAHPLTGVGLNNYVANYYFYSDWWEGFAKAVHSTWFSVLAEGGFLSFGIFVTMIVSTIRMTIRATNALSPDQAGAAYVPGPYGMAQAVLAGMSGFIVSGTFLTQAFTWPVYILVALSVAVARYQERCAPVATPAIQAAPVTALGHPLHA